MSVRRVKFLSAAEAAARIGISLEELQKLARHGSIAKYKAANGTDRFDEQDVERVRREWELTKGR